MFADIEFNREGVNFKALPIDGDERKIVRPDVIIHNRKTGPEKRNFLVVECKKQGASLYDIEYDREKIRAFMEDQKYEYSFGLQVVYGPYGVKGTLFFKEQGRIKCEEVEA